MGSDFGANLSLATGKEHALLPKRIGVPNPQAERGVESKVIEQQAPRETSLRWEKVENKGTKETDFQLQFEGATGEIGFTTVTTAKAVKAPSELMDIRNTLQQKFIELLESTYANCFHHNRLVAKVAEWTMGSIMSRLALLGMSVKELEKIKKRIRKRLIEENYTALCQVIYDETMLEIVT